MVYMSTVVFPFLFNRSMHYGCLVHISCSASFLFVVEQRKEVEDYIKSELIDGGSPKH